MPQVKLQHFTCPGAGPDSPEEGFEVLESDLPRLIPGTFLMDVESIKEEHVNIKVVEEEELGFDAYDFDAHPF